MPFVDVVVLKLVTRRIAHAVYKTTQKFDDYGMNDSAQWFPELLNANIPQTTKWLQFSLHRCLQQISSQLKFTSDYFLILTRITLLVPFCRKPHTLASISRTQ